MQDNQPTLRREAWHRPTPDQYIEWLYADVTQLLTEADSFEAMPEVVSRHGHHMSDIWEQKIYGSVALACDSTSAAYALGLNHPDYEQQQQRATEDFARATSWAFAYKAALVRHATEGAAGDEEWGQMLDTEAEKLRDYYAHHTTIAYGADYTMKHLQELYAKHERAIALENTQEMLDSADTILRFVASNFYASAEKYGIPKHTAHTPERMQ